MVSNVSDGFDNIGQALVVSPAARREFCRGTDGILDKIIDIPVGD